ncbi:GH32 C-terminal domain-containing protein [Paenibacillus sp. LHD-117]|uniref:GH32 C-terminal domain-containing protein n=1 Tax=Paenibacillus sp. LHD-117 TaxID=3071412 RepID=UPI0027E0C605|nr:GH32 C-terminal domain-containing protein [Paenibacillus sp. LHD-117]MDQ6423608.1 GH32 C-terminal domain-containing protein [Paenibacillus sp. LHD-117]
MKRKSFLNFGVLLTAIIISSIFLAYHAAAAAEFRSNVPGYVPITGTWSEQAGVGLKGVSASAANALSMTKSASETNFTLEADVTVDASTPYGVGSLVFLAAEDGSKGYALSVDPNLDRLRLFDLATGTTVGTPYAATLNPGSSYRLKVTADGSALKVYLGGSLAISVSDTKYAKGNYGFNVFNGTAYFQNVTAYDLHTNLTGWTASSGTWAPTSQGLRASAASGQNGYFMAGTSADNFMYEADVLVESTHALATLLFRSDAAGTQAYGLQVDANLNRLRLFKTSGNVTLATKTLTIDTGKVYQIRIKAEGSLIKVYFQQAGSQISTGYTPAIEITDASFASGKLGLGVFNGSVKFQNIRIGDLNTNLFGWTTAGGAWTPDLAGVKAVSAGTVNTFHMAENISSDFVLEGNLKVDAASPFGTAALVFRGNAQGTSGYVVNIDPNLDQVRLFNANGGNTIASASRAIDPGKTYHLEIEAVGSSIKVYLDGNSAPVITVTDTQYASGRIGMNAYNGTAYFQDVYVTDSGDWYSEPYRPQYHFTSPRNAVADPNGLVFYQGEYHLFHQEGGKWAHAVSTDLTHWKNLPIAIPWNDMGHAWSGAAIVDANDVSRLFGGGSGLLAYYTSFNPDKTKGNQKIGLAYSKDKGRTWSFYGSGAVVENPGGPNGGWDFRDPKVVWDGDHSKWVMVVSGGDHIRFYTSTNLINWTYASSFGYGEYLHGGIWECPDLFQLPVDGNPANKKWVLTISTGADRQTDGSASEYFVGSFDGTTFTSDNPAGTVLRSERGKDMYAAVSFSDIPAADGRRIQLGWMTNWDYPFSYPTGPWKGQLSIPRVLSLKNFTGEGIRLMQAPVAELQALRGTGASFSNVTVSPSTPNLLANFSGTAYEIVGEFEIPASGSAAEFGFRLRELGDQKTYVGYKPGLYQMFVNRTDAGKDDFTTYFSGWQDATIAPVNNRIKLHMFVDQSSVEVFGNDGKAVFSGVILPGDARDGLSFYSNGGNVKVVSLQVYPLANTWRGEPSSGTSPQKVVMDRTRLDLAPGATEPLYVSVLPRTASNKNVTWSSSNPAIATVSAADSRSANVTGIARGRAVITATTQAGGIVGRTVVEVGGAFNTNLTGFLQPVTGRWYAAADGIAGVFDQDTNYISTVAADNFTYESDMRLDASGGAGSLLFRSNADGSSGYYFNVDPNLRMIRLFYKLNGSFSANQMLASVPAFIQAGRTYHVKIVASGPDIKIYFDHAASPAIHVIDSTFASGYFGLNAFGGVASYQNVYWWPELTNAAVYRLINTGSGKALDAAGTADGANVQIWSYLGNDNQKWTLTTNADGTFTLTSAASGKALDASGTGDGANVQIWQNLGNANQKWIIAPNSDGTFEIKAANSGKALDVAGGGTADGTNVQIYSSNGTSAQKWQLIKS